MPKGLTKTATHITPALPRHSPQPTVPQPSHQDPPDIAGQKHASACDITPPNVPARHTPLSDRRITLPRLLQLPTLPSRTAHRPQSQAPDIDTTIRLCASVVVTFTCRLLHSYLLAYYVRASCTRIELPPLTLPDHNPSSPMRYHRSSRGPLQKAYDP